MGNERLIQALNDTYDRVMFDRYEQEVLGGDDFTNFGYWHDTTSDARDAHKNMMNEIVSRMSCKGAILDVACGKGASTLFLSKSSAGQPISGINISEKQIGICRSEVPDAKFFVMDATSLQFEDQAFGNVVCIEAAFHFNTRRKFLEEAYRVLRPGGKLILADIIINEEATPDGEKAESDEWIPTSNAEVATTEDYHHLLQSIGFGNIDIKDVTRECTDRFVDHCERFVNEKRARGEVDASFFSERMASLTWLRKVSRPYLLLEATR